MAIPPSGGGEKPPSYIFGYQRVLVVYQGNGGESRPFQRSDNDEIKNLVVKIKGKDTYRTLLRDSRRRGGLAELNPMTTLHAAALIVRK